MIPAARLSAAIEVLDDILNGQNAEAALTAWGRAHRFAGAGDRYAIRDLVFDALRRKRSYAAMGGGMTGRGIILGQLRASGADEDALFNGQGHAPTVIGPADQQRSPSIAEALDAPDWLIDVMHQELGTDSQRVLMALTARSPVFLRVNPIRATVAAAQAKLAKEGVATKLMYNIKYGLQVIQNERKIRNTYAYESGWIELQDASSQSVIENIDLPKTGRILDYCAGGGGKTLSIASQVYDNQQISVFAYDAIARRMADLPARAARAGAEITIINNHSKSVLYDLILTDVPCSGSGSWRRDPQGKWALTPAKLAETIALQSQIMDSAADLLAAGGTLAYATCSVLSRENEAQVSAFLTRHPEFSLRKMQRFGLSYPDDGDGFFLAVLSKSAAL
jgi:16S rRNA (cytosine967-C5)-methyltransferase